MYRQDGRPEIYLVTGYTDFRCGIDALCYRLKNVAKVDILSNSLFIFCNRGKDKLKMLYWGGAGFWLITYRLEQGKFEWFKNQELKGITYKQLEWLLEGINLNQKRYHNKVEKSLMF